MRLPDEEMVSSLNALQTLSSWAIKSIDRLFILVKKLLLLPQKREDKKRKTILFLQLFCCKSNEFVGF